VLASPAVGVTDGDSSARIRPQSQWISWEVTALTVSVELALKAGKNEK
jgi:hypothetical protein